MKKVLLIDDEVSFAELVRLSLEDAGGYIVKTEYRGEHGLDAIRNFNPDIIVLDMMMPEMNGLEVLQMLKTNDKTKDIPVIILSAVKSNLVKRQTAGNYNETYLEKPITVENLKRVIEEILVGK
ncbi:MAG: response regulator [Candidatus Omnitrophica bacterium]|nr:response regulator [Candidatus Omnitrophota bacterium]MBU4478097.1 response regulator [Candidatus Omnitrophota bacterium]MCG2704407.1 response regulator [Candidatus Omnitrophota bacterium]